MKLLGFIALLTVILFFAVKSEYCVVIVYFPFGRLKSSVAMPFLFVVLVYVFPLTFRVTFLFGDALP